MRAEIIEKIKTLLEKKEQAERDLGSAACVLREGGPYFIQGNMALAHIPQEYAMSILKAHINNLTQQIAEIDQELENI